MNGSGRRRTITALALFGVVAGMVGLSFASVPLYRLFCQVTGYGGTLNTADVTVPHAASDRFVTVRFDANVNSALPWRFMPVQNEVRVRLGEETLAHYVATNLSQSATTGTATFNVTPFKAAPYFNKIECFCFTEQTLHAGAEASMPVSFFVDAEILDDPDTRDVKTITLSYTFFPVDSDSGEQGDRREIARERDDQTTGG